MNGKNLNFDNKYIKKATSTIKIKIYLILMILMLIKYLLVSKKEQYGKHNSFKYFIGYNDNNVIKPLYLFLSQTTLYINKFDKNNITIIK